MPTTYAHYTFGGKVLNELNDELREDIKRNIELFHIGLHGPDIFFYYKPLKSNEINKLGNEIHKQNANIFFEKSKEILCQHEKASAYIAGFICHFMLDSQCHPYIRTKENEISHNEIEAEFDRAIMLKDNLNPITFKPTSHIAPSIGNAECISKFFPETTPQEILKSLSSMKFYLNLLVAPGKLQRALLISALKISGNDNKISLIKKYSPNEECLEINEELMRLYDEAIKPAALLIKEYIMSTNEKINERFYRNFG
ncbi:MAG: zinc dependent phospholipase C family protein [Sedimentibacter sp.]